MREYLAQRKLYDIALWQSKTMEEKPQNKRKIFTLRSAVYSMTKIAAMIAIVFLIAHYWKIKILKNILPIDLCSSRATCRIDTGRWDKGMAEFT